MNRKFFTASILAFAAFCAVLRAQTGSTPEQVGAIPLPHVEGRIDHFSVDLKGHRLFMSALGNNTLEVIDVQSNRWLQSISGLHHPQGVLFVPATNRLFVANAEGGQVVIYEGESLKKLTAVDGLEDADNVRLDAAANQVYVGYGDGALAVLDARDGKRLGEIKLDGHPESFQLEKSGPRIFVNVPTAGHIAVIDRHRKQVIARWPLAGFGANFPMQLDEANHRLFVACRKPAVLLVIDTESGKIIAHPACPGDADDLWFDAAAKRLYVSGGEGFIGVIEQRGPDLYVPVVRMPSAPGARTSFFVPDLRELYLAVPHRASQGCEVRVYSVGKPSKI